MRLHSQNLNEGGLKLWHGRAWLRTRRDYEGREFHWEWQFGRKVRDFAAWVEFGNGDDDAGILFHLCLPFLFSIFLGWDGVYNCRECKLGVAIHNTAIWLYTLSLTMDSPKESDGWHRKTHSWYFPWDWDWFSTEILDHDMETVWAESVHAKPKGMCGWGVEGFAKQSVSRQYPYTYTRKNGHTQSVTATVCVERRVWRRRWPIIPGRKVSTCIDVKFSSEVGEGVDTWKGGCVGCGYEIRPGETPEMCLRRMEQERKFDR